MSQAIFQTEDRPNDDAILTSLKNIVGDDHVLPAEGADPYAVDGVVPRAVVFPATEHEVEKVMAYANNAGLKVSPRGGGTQTGLGNIPAGVDIVLGLERLNRIVAHEPADMTVTVQSGLALSRLQATLAESGQFLPVDPPLGDDATVGGILATRAFGPLRFGFRTISDFLLGIKVVTAQGKTAKAGGRVVKNVTGYELGRLYTGSVGTLAVIVEATFKVQPLPRQRSILMMPCPDMNVAQQYVRALIECGVQPVLFELLSSAGDESNETGLAQLINEATSNKPKTGPLLAVGFMGTDEEVTWQVEKSVDTLNGLMTPPAFVTSLEWDSVYPHLISAHRGRVDKEDHHVICRVHMKDTELYAYLDRLIQENDKDGGDISFVAHAGSGVARLRIPGENRDRDNVVGSLNTLRERAEAVGGRLIIEKAPLWVKEKVDVWGTPGADFFLHQAVKDKMDPKRLLNPGRFIGGI